MRCHEDRGCTAQLFLNLTLIRMSAARPMQQVELRDPSEAARQMQLLVQTAQAQGQVEAHAMHPPTQNFTLYHTALDTAEKLATICILTVAACLARAACV